LPAATFKLTQNWTVSGAALYSLDSERINTSSVGFGYIDECIALNMNYVTNYGFSGSVVPTHMVTFSINLRTLGGSNFSQSLAAPNSTNTGLWGRL
jgi:LPS-assembly protein